MNDLTSYYSIRPDTNTGDLIEWQSKTFIGWAIRKVTGRVVNHTSLIVRFQLEGDESKRRYVLEAVGGGIHLHLLSKRLREHNGKAWWLPLDDKYNDRRGDILNYALNKVGTKYDYKSVIKQLFCRVSIGATRFFCSEYCQIAYQWAQIIKPPLKTALRPGEWEELCVHKGSVRIL